MTETELKDMICEVGRRMYQKDMVAATDGNISARLGPDRFVCTPSGVSKGFLRPEELIVADGQGNKIAGSGRVTTEFFTHLAAYEERPDIQAVVHGHPPMATALMIAGYGMAEPVIPELVMALGTIPTAAYATPGSREGSGVIRDLIRQHDAVLIDRHGAVTVGATPLDAYFKLEKVEHSALIYWAAHALGNVRVLDDTQVTRLRQSGSNYHEQSDLA